MRMLPLNFFFPQEEIVNFVPTIIQKFPLMEYLWFSKVT